MSELPDSSAALGGGWPRLPQRISVPEPPGWYLKESITLLEPGGEANVIFSSEPLDPDIDTARYAAVQGALLRDEFPGYVERRFEAARTFGRDGFRRVFEWTPPDGEPVTQIQLYYAEAGVGYTATATVTSDAYERHRDNLIGVLGELLVTAKAPEIDPERTETTSAAAPSAADTGAVEPAHQLPPEGWYEDPESRGRGRRFFDGAAWTDHFEFPEPPPPPQAAVSPPPPAPAPPPASMPAGSVARERSGLRDRLRGSRRGRNREPELAAAEPAAAAGRPEGSPVDCSVYGPARVARGQTAFIQAFAHLIEQAADARALAEEFDPGTTRRGLRRLEVGLNDGDRLSFELSAKGVEIEDPHGDLVWSGRAEPVQFAVHFPASYAGETAIFTLLISLDSVPVGQLRFKVDVEDTVEATHGSTLEAEASAFKRAFISYASADRDAVLGYVQVLRAVGLDFFQDVVDLEPGTRWERRLQESIPESDLFLLFWSSQARESEWVRREVTLALEAQGDDADARPPHIRPVILEGPPPPPPWPELEHLHFNDPLLYLRGSA